MPAEWPWMRLYSEARVDKKLSILTDAQHRVWFHLLCFAGERPRRGEISDITEFELAVECAGGDETLLRETLKMLNRLNIICVGDGEDDYDTIRFLNWEKRQYDKPSDRPEATAERKRMSRARAKSHADLPSNSVVSRDVTPGHAQEKEEELEKELEREREHTHEAPAAPARGYPPDFEAWWKRYPSGHGNKKASAARWTSLSVSERRAAEDGLGKWLACGRWKRGMVKAAEIWLRDRWWEDKPPDDAARASPPSNGRATLQDFLDLMHDEGGDEPPGDHQVIVDPPYAVSNGQAVGAGGQRHRQGMEHDAHGR